MNYKLMAVDIDGTLLNSKENLTIETVNAVKQSVKKGLKFVISTGRPIQGVKKLISELGIDMPVITYNGAVVLTGKTHNIIYQKNLSCEDSKIVYKLGCDKNVLVAMWIDGKLFVNKINEKSDYYSSITGIKPILTKNTDELLKNGTTKIIWFADEQTIEKYLLEIDPLIPNTTTFHTSRPYFLEFVDKYATKAVAMEKLGEYFNISQKEMIAIGDGYNDLSMIKYAGLGIAMDNAKDEIKHHANFITKSNDDNGVAYAINKFIL